MKQIQLLMITVLFLYTGCVSSKPEYTVDDFKCYPNAVYLFRHAEKQIIKGEKNPELTKTGFSRAAALADSLKSIQNGVIFSSEFSRTQQTVNPLSEKWETEVMIHSAHDPEGQVERALDNCRKTVIISGHSNTLPNLIKLFGVDDEITIEDSQYGDLFMIQWLNGLPTLTTTQVGE